MDTVKIKETGLEKLHSEWTSCLSAYSENLQFMDGLTQQLQSTVHDLLFQRDLQRVRTELVLQKNVVEQLNNEVSALHQRYLQKEDKGLLTLADLIENNRLRDRILKTEKAVFVLKCQVSKILSLAS